MRNKIPPPVSQWYRHLEKGQPFQMVAVDEQEPTVEMQYFDGDVEEVDFDDWYGLRVEAMEPPEDGTSPVDNVERDDLGYAEAEMRNEDWEESLHRGGVPLEKESDEGEDGCEEE